MTGTQAGAEQNSSLSMCSKETDSHVQIKYLKSLTTSF